MTFQTLPVQSGGASDDVSGRMCKCRYVKLVETYPGLKAMIDAKGASVNYLFNGLDTFLIKITFAKICKISSLWYYGILSVDWRAKCKFYQIKM